MKHTGIRSYTTISECFKKLEEQYVIYRAPDGIPAYCINIPRLYVRMDVGIIRVLLAFHKYIDTRLLILAFILLTRLYQTQGSEYSFTKTDFGALLGVAHQHVDAAGVLIMFFIFEGLGIAKLTREPYKNRMGVDCIRFRIAEIDLEGKNIVSFLGKDNEPDKHEIMEIWGKALTGRI